jgi:uncharacterized membrane protein
VWGREPVFVMGLILAIFLVVKEVFGQFGYVLTPGLDVALDGLAVAITAFVTRSQVTPNQAVGLRLDGKPPQ